MVMLAAPKYNPATRVEQRYAAASKALKAWRTAALAALEAEYEVRAAANLAARDRDFQAHGLNQAGTGPA